MTRHQPPNSPQESLRTWSQSRIIAQAGYNKISQIMTVSGRVVLKLSEISLVGPVEK
jgi:hypothetical protein